MTYLDHAATTPVLPEVVAAMSAAFAAARVYGMCSVSASDWKR